MFPEESFRFKQAVPAEERRRQADAQMRANPDFIPVVCESVPGDVCSELPSPLLVVPVEATIGSLAALLKGQLHTKRRMILRVRGKPCFAENDLGGLHELYKDPEDHCLYIRYSTIEPEPAVTLAEALVLATLAGSVLLGALLFVRRRGTAPSK